MPGSNHLVAASRRGFLGFAGAVLTAGWPASGQPRFSAPVVDRLTVQVLVDNSTFGPFLPDQDLPGLKVRRANGDSGPRMSPDALIGEFGLSLLGVSRVRDQTRRVLVDFGYTGQALANNIALLDIDPEKIDAAVLSHGHLDHYGGFPGLFSRLARKARNLPLIVGGEETFCERVAMIASPPRLMGSLDRRALARAGFEPRLTTTPAVVADHAFTTGVIPLTSGERIAIPTAMRPGVGCDSRKLSVDKRGAGQLPDDAEHEIATCYLVRDLGLVVVSSCSHRGVLNAVRQAQSVSGVEKVHAVIGGFHLVRPRTEVEARDTAAAFAAIAPRYLIPMHCSGDVFIAEATRLMPGRVIRPYVGTQFLFEA